MAPFCLRTMPYWSSVFSELWLSWMQQIAWSFGMIYTRSNTGYCTACDKDTLLMTMWPLEYFFNNTNRKQTRFDCVKVKYLNLTQWLQTMIPILSSTASVFLQQMNPFHPFIDWLVGQMPYNLWDTKIQNRRTPRLYLCYNFWENTIYVYWYT